MKKKLFRVSLSGIALCAILFSGCKKDYSNDDDHGYNGHSNNNQGNNKIDLEFYAMADGITLDKFSTKYPGKAKKSVKISGLQSGEKLLAIDFRPATGQLYGVGATSRIYVVNPATGAARMIGATPFTPAINGSIVGFDFNPTVDRIRLVTSTGQNLRLNPETGGVAFTDGNINLAGQNPMLAAVAYENAIAGATTTTLYAIDLASKKLFRINPPNNGTLEEVGSLGLNISGEGGYDIDGPSNTGLAIFKVNGRTTLFTVDDETAKTKVLATYYKNYSAIAIPTQDVAYAASAMNTLLIFNPNSSDAPVAKPFTGLSAGETVIGLDMRPVNGQLYALGSGSHIYTINASSGAAAFVGPLSTNLSGSDFGFDFNPVVDRIRIVSNTGQNLRVNPADAVAIVDGPINPGGRAITAVAYLNNFAGATSTVLFDIDVTTDKLYRQDPSNAGTLVEVGNLGVNVEAMSGFDIGGTSNSGYALLKSGSTTNLYRVNVTSFSSSSNILTFKRSFPSSVTGFTLGLGF